MRRPVFRWRRRPVDDNDPERLHAWALIHLGMALRAHQQGDSVRALRHLGQAGECIVELIEQWRAER